MQCTVEVVIKRDVEDVWAFVADVRRNPEWIKAMSDMRVPDGQEFGPGFRYGARYRVGGKLHDTEMVVVDCQKPDHMSIQGTGPFAFTSRLRFTPVDGGTRLSHELEVGADGCFTWVMFAILPFLVRVSMRTNLMQELDQLKTILESGS